MTEDPARSPSLRAWRGLQTASEGTGISGPLSEQVNLLGAMVGQAIREQWGDRAFGLVEELRHLCKRAEAESTAEQKAVEADRKALAAELAGVRESLERITGERAELVRALSPPVLATFELVARRRNGIAVAEARDGVCTICHVRLRPQVFNVVRRNDEIVQCDSCQRILYFAGVREASAAGQAAIDAATTRQRELERPSS